MIMISRTKYFVSFFSLKVEISNYLPNVKFSIPKSYGKYAFFTNSDII